MAQTLDQAERLVSAAEARGLVYAVGFMRRHDEGVQIAKRMLNELRETQELGRIIFTRCYLFAGGDYCNISGCIETEEPKPTHLIWPVAPDWVPLELHREYEHFLNVCSHGVNLIRFLFPRPRIKHVEYRRQTGGVVVMDFGEFSGVFEWGDIALDFWDEGVEIYFERGRLRLILPPAFLRNCPAHVELYKDNGKSPAQTIYPRPGWTWSFRREDEAFVQDVLAQRQPVASGADGLEDMRMVEDIWWQVIKGVNS